MSARYILRESHQGQEMGEFMKIAPKEIRRLLTYDEVTGIFKWKRRDPEGHRCPRTVKTWNTRYAEKQAGNRYYQSGNKHTQYIRIGVLGRDYDAHRLAWAYHYGKWPCQGIDHIDGDGTNNRISNLRLASQKTNCRNSKRRSDNTSGICGVRFDADKGKWRVDIAGKFIGRFSTLLDAASCRKSLEKSMGFSDRHGL